MNQLEDLLRENRPELTPMELDRVKQRALAQANRKTMDIYGWKGIRIMRPRLVATSLLVAGMFFTGSGATLAVISDSGSAGVVQYPESSVPTPTQTTGTTTPTQTTQNTTTPGGNEVLGENFSGGQPQQQTAPATQPGSNEVLGARTGGGSLPSKKASAPAKAAAPAAVQANRQLGNNGGGKELPFTGFAAIPVLLIGILMLSTGIALRRTMRRNEA